MAIWWKSTWVTNIFILHADTEVYPYVSLTDLLNIFPVVFILVPFRHPFTK